MKYFKVHTVQSAPAESRKALEQVKTTFGFIPNQYGVLAESPAALAMQLDLNARLAKTSFTPTELFVIFMTNDAENQCKYGLAVDGVLAGMQKVPAHVISALKEGKPLQEQNLETLRQFTLAVLKKKSAIDAQDINRFFEAGYTKANLIEVVLASAQKMVSNYVNRVAETDLDDAYQKEKAKGAA